MKNIVLLFTGLVLAVPIHASADPSGYFCKTHRSQTEQNALTDFRKTLLESSADSRKYADDPIVDSTGPIVRGCPLVIFQPKIVGTAQTHRGDIVTHLQASYFEAHDSPAELICRYEGEEPSGRGQPFHGKTLIFCAKLRNR